MFGGNPGGKQGKEDRIRLGDFWRLHLLRPNRREVMRQCQVQNERPFAVSNIYLKWLVFRVCLCHWKFNLRFVNVFNIWDIVTCSLVPGMQEHVVLIHEHMMSKTPTLLTLMILMTSQWFQVYIRKARFSELAQDDPMTALTYLHSDLAVVINHQDSKEEKEVTKILSRESQTWFLS